MERFDEAIDCCNRCLAYDPANAGVLTALTKARTAQAAKNEKIKARDARLLGQEQAIAHLAAAFKVR